MIPNHKQFIEAITEKHKVNLRFYSRADSGVIDLICAPMAYGPGPDAGDGVNRYWFWDYTSNTGSPTLGLLPQQVLKLQILGQLFDPADFNAPPLNVLPFPNFEATKTSGAPIQSTPSAGAEQNVSFPQPNVPTNPNQSQSHESLWKNTKTKIM